MKRHTWEPLLFIAVGYVFLFLPVPDRPVLFGAYLATIWVMMLVWFGRSFLEYGPDLNKDEQTAKGVMCAVAGLLWPIMWVVTHVYVMGKALVWVNEFKFPVRTQPTPITEPTIEPGNILWKSGSSAIPQAYIGSNGILTQTNGAVTSSGYITSSGYWTGPRSPQAVTHIVDAAAAFVKAYKEVEPEILRRFQLAEAHGLVYNGPTYKVELEMLICSLLNSTLFNKTDLGLNP